MITVTDWIRIQTVCLPKRKKLNVHRNQPVTNDEAQVRIRGYRNVGETRDWHEQSAGNPSVTT